MENAAETKKPLSILSRWLYIAFVCLLFSSSSWSQEEAKDPKSTTWKQEKKYLKYERTDDYKGPQDWFSSEPSDIKENEYNPSQTVRRRMYGRSGGSIRFKPQQVQRQRQKDYSGFDRGGGRGTLKYDPKVKRPAPIRPKNMPNPDMDMPTPDTSLPSTSDGFWKIVFVLILIALAMTIVYVILRNRQPKDEKVVIDVEEEWNPEIISKTELELKLEAAMAREDYRECVRIYFTFILKELIKKGWIRWKKEKTNHHYVMEMGGREGSLSFMECVRIYDLVWYGDYQIDREIFEMLQPSLLNYYKSLDPKDDE